MALAPLLYNITFDSQTRILYFWDKAGHEIYHCEIPSPAPALPTVRLIGDSNYNYWLYVGSTVNQSSTLANNATAPLYSVPGSSFPGWTVYPKATVGYYNKQGDYYTLVGRVGLEPEEVVHPVYGVRVFGCRNVSGSSITFVRARIAQCNSTDATVITVYDSSNNPYNAFQYTSDGTDYYYVLDGTQTDWTDDLASIGYSLTPVIILPTVSMSGDFGEDNNWLYCDNGGTNHPVSPDNTIYVHPWSGSASWDNTKSYAVLLWATYQASQGYGNWGFSVEKGSNNNNFYARNISSDTLYLYCLRVAVCSDSTATVITVYDSSNNPYNAFQYTSDGTDYYYVLDGTQTDWTDDLASIGYQQSRKAYANANKTDRYMFRNTPSNVYDSDGNTIPFVDINLLGVFMADGTSLGTYGFQLTNNGGLLALNYYGGSGTYAGYAEYTIL